MEVNLKTAAILQSLQSSQFEMAHKICEFTGKNRIQTANIAAIPPLITSTGKSRNLRNERP